MQLAIDYLLNYYIQNEYAEHLKIKMSSYSGKMLSGLTLEIMQTEMTHWIHQVLHNCYEGQDLLKLNPQANIKENPMNPGELTVRFSAHPSMKVTEGYF